MCLDRIITNSTSPEKTGRHHHFERASMLQAERNYFAETMTQRAAKTAGEQGGIYYGETLKHKMLLAINTIDRLCASTTRPILVTSVIPGYDLFVTRAQATGEPVFDPVDPRALTALDENNLTLIAQFLDTTVAGRSEGAGLFESEDGTRYVGFKSVYREAALKAMGIEMSGLMAVPAGVLQ
jgi:hypothetical protein